MLLATSVSLVLLGACRDEAPGLSVEEFSGDAATAEACLWGVDALLREVGANAEEDYQDCGSADSSFPSEPDVASCFLGAVGTKAAARAHVNMCIDCYIAATYVTTEAGEHFAITTTLLVPGSSNGSALVERCDSFELLPSDLAGDHIVCSEPQPLYECAGLLPMDAIDALP